MESKNPKSTFDIAADERKFLHDVANPLAVAGGMLEAFRGEVERSGIEMSEPLHRKLGKIEAALDRMGALLKERRLVLIATQAESDSDAGPTELLK